MTLCPWTQTENTTSMTTDRLGTFCEHNWDCVACEHRLRTLCPWPHTEMFSSMNIDWKLFIHEHRLKTLHPWTQPENSSSMNTVWELFVHEHRLKTLHQWTQTENLLSANRDLEHIVPEHRIRMYCRLCSPSPIKNTLAQTAYQLDFSHQPRKLSLAVLSAQVSHCTFKRFHLFTITEIKVECPLIFFVCCGGWNGKFGRENQQESSKSSTLPPKLKINKYMEVIDENKIFNISRHKNNNKQMKKPKHSNQLKWTQHPLHIYGLHRTCTEMAACSFTWQRPCKNQIALSVHHFGG